MHYVYLIISINKDKTVSYVGYTNNIKKRVKLHNNSKGAKFTRGRKWRIIYKETYNNKRKAMSREHEIKKNTNFRNLLREKN